MKPELTAIGWYRREDYEALLSVFADADKLAATFDDWLAKAQEAEKSAKRRGLRTIRAYIDPVRFPQWCAERGLKIDVHSRGLFGNTCAVDVLRKEKIAESERLKAKRKKR